MKKITLSIIALFSAVLVNAQSDCSTAQAISVAADASTTVSVTNGVNGTPATTACLTTDSASAQYGVWYTYTSTQDLMVTVTANTPTSNSDYVPTMSLMSGDCTTLVCENSDYYGSNGNTTSPNTAEITFFAASGVTNYIYFDDLFSQLGSGTTAAFNFTVSTSSTLPTAPGVATNPTPADGATDVAIGTASTGESSVDFAWDAPTTGDAPDSYNIVISTDPTFQDTNATISGTFANNTVDGLYLPGSNYFVAGTTYYWYVVPENAGGTADTNNVVVWSFTTAGTLSTKDFETVSLSH